MVSRIQLESNKIGRDYIVGDLHGCYSKLQDKLRAAGFEPSIDRVFSVGDLTDRGPESMKCLELINEPWFYAVQGNHDRMLMTYVLGTWSTYHRAGDFIRNGGEWALTADKEYLHQLAEQVAKLPLVIETPDFYVAHARLSIINDPDYFVWDRSLVQEDLYDLGTKDILQENDIFVQVTPYTGDKICYVGHNRTKKVVYINNHCMIDTNAYADDGHLTVLEHKEFIKGLKCLK